MPIRKYILNKYLHICLLLNITKQTLTVHFNTLIKMYYTKGMVYEITISILLLSQEYLSIFMLLSNSLRRFAHLCFKTDD